MSGTANPHDPWRRRGGHPHSCRDGCHVRGRRGQRAGRASGRGRGSSGSHAARASLTGWRRTSLAAGDRRRQTRGREARPVTLQGCRDEGRCSLASADRGKERRDAALAVFLWDEGITDYGFGVWVVLLHGGTDCQAITAIRTIRGRIRKRRGASDTERPVSVFDQPTGAVRGTRAAGAFPCRGS